jgi:apolipoprotein N-acyltransferase
VILLTWVVFQIGCALGVLLRRLGDRTIDVRLAASGIVASLAVVALGAVAPRAQGTGVFLDIAAVQGGGEQGTRADDVPSEVVTQRHLEATRSIEPDDDLDLVLWPENVVDVAEFAGSPELDEIAAEAQRLDVPISVGVTEDVPGEPDRFTNAQVIVTPDGISSRYDKVRRVPFGEYVPLRGLLDALGAPVDQVPNDAVAGTEPAILDLPDGTRLGVVISWEVFFGGRARDGVREGAEAIVNPTNGASYSGTIVQTQQIASSRLRALETGRWVVQAAPTGFSAFVTPGGDVYQRTAVSERAVIREEVELRRGETWYVRLGDAPVIAVMVIGLAATWWMASRGAPSLVRR